MKIFLLLLATAFSLNTKAQTTEDSIKTAVNNLFIAMKNADGNALKDAFTSTAVLQTIGKAKEGTGMMVNTQDVNSFATSISKLSKDDADEQIVFETIKIDADLAIAWTPYKFYFKGKFSHCGVNSFQLVRLNGEWKIQYIIDTRRKDACL